MVGWSHLPAEIKQHVVKKLDFMGRHSLRNVSHLDRQIVDSTRLKVPRVRFGYKESKCLIVIYTGIDRFLRLELSTCQGGTVIHRSENNFDPKEVSTKRLQSPCPLQLTCTILKSLFAQKSITLKFLELDINALEFNAEFLLKLRKSLAGVQFRVETLVSLHQFGTFEVFQKMLGFFCISIELKAHYMMHLHPFSDNLTPVMNSRIIRDVDGMLEEIKAFAMKKPSNFQKMVDSTAGDPELDGLNHPSYTIISVLEPSSKLINYRKAIDHYVDYYYQTACGKWRYRVKREHEQRWLKELKNDKCGLEVLCKTHADPFDYWYHQNLPLRYLHEPFWTEFTYKEFADEEQIRILRGKLAQNEKIRIQKTKYIQKTSSRNVTSWGFRQVSIECLMTSFELDKNLKHKKKKKWGNKKNSDDVKDSEDVRKGSEILDDVKDSEVLEDVNDSDDIKALEDAMKKSVVLKDFKDPEDRSDDVNDNDNVKSLDDVGEDSEVLEVVNEDSEKSEDDELDSEASEDVEKDSEDEIDGEIFSEELTPEDPVLADEISENLPTNGKINEKLSDDVINSENRLKKYVLISSAFVAYHIFMAIIFYWFFNYFKF